MTKLMTANTATSTLPRATMGSAARCENHNKSTASAAQKIVMV